MASYCMQDEIKYEKKMYKYCMWDTAGQEKYKGITKLFIRKAKIILLVYAIDNLTSFKEIDTWINVVKTNIDNDKYIMALVANKSDLFESQEVTDDEGKELAEKYEIDFLVTSALLKAKSFKNFVDKQIIKYIKMIEGNGEANEKNNHIKIKNSKKEDKNKKKCC